MADPFSIFAGAVGIADVCLRTGNYLRCVHKTAKHVDADIEALEREVVNFRQAYDALDRLCTQGTLPNARETKRPGEVDDPCMELWARSADLIREGKALVEKLQSLFVGLLGDDPNGAISRPHRFDDVRKAIKLLSKDKEFTKIRTRLITVNMELNMMLIAIELASNSHFRSNAAKSFEQLSSRMTEDIQRLGLQLKSAIEKLETTSNEVDPSIASAKATIAFTSLNEHFYIQQSDTSIWTGRKKYLEEVRNRLLTPDYDVDKVQRRFVVYGISGAGKTQFCSKFAQDYRESFWGIFWIDASSRQNAAESWKEIAKIGKRDGNEEAGKHWLSNLHSPWLLIIDSADNCEDWINKQFPSGERGCILITTRNPRLRFNATAGYLSLDKLEEDEANDLLRKATRHEPWDVSANTSANSIARHLGYLPLALLHAGKAIFHRLVDLHGYIPWFNRILDSFHTKNQTEAFDEDERHGMETFVSFDIIYAGLEAQSSRSGVCKDALELLNTFAFIHNSDICLDIITKAGENLHESASARQIKDKEQSSSAPAKSTPIRQRIQNLITMWAMKLNPYNPVVPHLLSNSKLQPYNDYQARRAVDLLVRMSLISESSGRDSYSMHPLVHVWVRKRQSTAAQALWCETAANVLASSIKIPPLIDEQGDQAFYLRILPHVVQIQISRKEVENQLRKNREGRSLLRNWLLTLSSDSFTVGDAYNSARYSRVFMECGKLSEAEVLQRQVKDFVIKLLGKQHLLCASIQLPLSKTLWLQGQAGEAQELQEEALQICRNNLGDKDPRTLRVMDALGETYWHRGWLKESRALHEAAIDGMKDNKSLVRDRFMAINHLGRVHDWYTDFEKSKIYHKEASEGLVAEFGDDDLDAMIATDAYATTLLQLGGRENTSRAYELMQGVYERREKKLGRENIFTLWAACNLARTAAARGSLEMDQSFIDQSKAIFKDGLEIANRNLGPNHIGTLMGRSHSVKTLVLEKKYDEAEKEYKDIAELQKHILGARNGSHRDRLYTLRELVECYEEQEKHAEANDVCETIIAELDAMGGQKHPMRQQIKRKQEFMVAQKSSSSNDIKG